MKLYWSSRSPFARKVMIAAHEVGLDGEIDKTPIVVGMSSPNATLMPLNPLSRIPTLERDDGTVLTDSLVICEYLDRLEGRHRLIPADGPARVETLARHALASGLIEIAVLRRNERDRPDGARSEPHLAAFGMKTRAALDHFERDVADGVWNNFDVAGVALASALGYLDFRFPDEAWRQGRPALTRWHHKIATRPSVKATEHA